MDINDPLGKSRQQPVREDQGKTGQADKVNLRFIQAFQQGVGKSILIGKISR